MSNPPLSTYPSPSVTPAEPGTPVGKPPPTQQATGHSTTTVLAAAKSASTTTTTVKKKKGDGGNGNKHSAAAQKLSYKEQLRRYDLFEQRWNAEYQFFYMFNPYTGETLCDIGDGYYDRSKSTWAPPQKPSKYSDLIEVFPARYASRSWGKRRFVPYEDFKAAALHITAVARGYLARKALRDYFRMRYLRVLDRNSGYFYFADKFNLAADTVWYKPRLAFPDDVKIYDPYENDKEDFMKGEKYTHKSFTKGPYIKKARIGGKQSEAIRAENDHFVKRNPERSIAIKNPEDLDLSKYPVDSIIPLIDGHKLKHILVTDYQQIRTACVNDNWAFVVDIMRKYPDRPLTQIYGFHCLSKMKIALDPTAALTDASRDGMYMCYDILQRSTVEKVNNAIISFMLRALHSFLSCTAGMAEFFELTNEEGKSAVAEREAQRRISKRLNALVGILERIEMERIEFKMKEGAGYTKYSYDQVTPRGAEIAEFSLLNISTLCHNMDNRELVALVCCDAVVAALRKCPEEAGVVFKAMQCLYNFCYRCEGGQDVVRRAKVRRLILTARDQFKGDFEVLRQCRRLELALEDFGWRGHVEDIIDVEEYNLDKMDGLHLDDSALEMRKARSSYLDEVRGEKLQNNLFKDKGLWDPVDVIPNVHQAIDDELGTSRSKVSTRSLTLSALHTRPLPQTDSGAVSHRSNTSGVSTVSGSTKSGAGRHALKNQLYDEEDEDLQQNEGADNDDKREARSDRASSNGRAPSAHSGLGDDDDDAATFASSQFSGGH